MPTDKAGKSRRQSLLAQIHIGLKRSRITEKQYRDFLEEVTGKRSAGDLTDAELEMVARAVRESGTLDGKNRGGRGIHQEDRPSDGQWDKLAWLARELGWTGLSDARLATVSRRVAKVSSPRFLTKHGMRDLLIALEQSAERSLARRSAEAERA